MAKRTVQGAVRVSNKSVLDMLTALFGVTVDNTAVQSIVYDDNTDTLVMWDSDDKLGGVFLVGVTEYTSIGLSKDQFKTWLRVNGATSNFPDMA